MGFSFVYSCCIVDCVFGLLFGMVLINLNFGFGLLFGYCVSGFVLF